MEIIDIFSDTEISIEVFQKCVEELFPAWTIFYWEKTSDPPETLDFENPNHGFFNDFQDTGKIEFGFNIMLERAIKEDYQMSQIRNIHIARHLARKTGRRILIPYTDPNDRQNPYESLIFENDTIFLADDFQTNFADGAEGLVKIIEPIHFPEFQFTPSAVLINEAHLDQPSATPEKWWHKLFRTKR